MKPFYAHPGDAGFDITCCEKVTIYDFPTLVRTGLVFEIPRGWELQIRSRSGLTLRQGIVVAQGTGTVDADYRGELLLMMRVIPCEMTPEDHDIPHPVSFEAGSRLAQGVFAPIRQAIFTQVSHVSEDTTRGSGGFGSTGV